MRVALVCPYAWDRFGGVQSHVKALARALRDRGHDVGVLAPHSSGRPGDADATHGGVTLVGHAVSIPANGSVAPLAFGPLAAAGVRRALHLFEPDVVHLHEPLIPSLSLLALWSAAAPTVGTFHASAEASAGYRLARPVLQRAAGRLTVRTAVSDAARALASRYFPARYDLTPNGVDMARFEGAAPLDLAGKKKVLFFGRLERRKGLEVLIQAMTRLRDLDAELVVAGSGPEEKAARALAQRLLVEARWLGAVEDRDKAAVYKAADVYCAPGLGGESFGIVLIEAMAAGAPVVCSDLPGFRDVAGGAGELVPAGEAGPLADALRAVLCDDIRAKEMRAAGQRRAATFDWTRLVANVESLYQRALESAA